VILFLYVHLSDKILISQIRIKTETFHFYIFSENNKILPKYNVVIINKPGDAKEPETLEEIENQVMQRIYSYDSFGNITKIYEDLSDNWIYSIETEPDENNNWLTKKIYRKKTDGSVILYYDYFRKINYFEK
jgi:hypothetical protein